MNNENLKKDVEAYSILLKERERQERNVELIASENFVSNAVREANGSIFTNKYAEGYPKKRYYGGCEYIDEMENLAIERAKKLFSCSYANVQPHSGSQANMEVYKALLQNGDTILGMSLDSGGHLSHGYSLSFSGQEYKAFTYSVEKDTGLLNYENIRELAGKIKPKLIICGASAYPRVIDFKAFKSIASEVNAYLVADIAHIAGLVATGLHNSPLDCCDVVTSTTHKTLRGPRGGLILSNHLEYQKAIDKAVFPTCQGGPLENTIAAKAVAFAEDLRPEYKEYMKNVVNNCKAFCEELTARGAKLITGGSDNHLCLVDVKTSYNLTGLEAQKLLEECNITANKNSIPYDQEKPAYASGMRFGTPAMTTRGYTTSDFKEIASYIDEILSHPLDIALKNQIKEKIRILNARYPLPYESE